VLTVSERIIGAIRSYLGMARVMFEEMDFQYDLDELEKIIGRICEVLPIYYIFTVSPTLSIRYEYLGLPNESFIIRTLSKYR